MVNANVDGCTKTLNLEKIIRKMQTIDNLLKTEWLLKPKYESSWDLVCRINRGGGDWPLCPPVSCSTARDSLIKHRRLRKKLGLVCFLFSEPSREPLPVRVELGFATFIDARWWRCYRTERRREVRSRAMCPTPPRRRRRRPATNVNSATTKSSPTRQGDRPVRVVDRCTGMGGGLAGGAKAPPKVLIWWKFGKNPLKFGKISENLLKLPEIWAKMAPSFDLKTMAPRIDMNRFFTWRPIWH